MYVSPYACMWPILLNNTQLLHVYVICKENVFAFTDKSDKKYCTRNIAHDVSDWQILDFQFCLLISLLCDMVT